MSSAIYFNLDKSKNLSSGNGLRNVWFSCFLWNVRDILFGLLFLLFASISLLETRLQICKIAQKAIGNTNLNFKL